jgi:hypothetical protein
MLPSVCITSEMMTGALLVRNSGSIAYLLAATFYKGDLERKHKF